MTCGDALVRRVCSVRMHPVKLGLSAAQERPPAHPWSVMQTGCAAMKATLICPCVMGLQAGTELSAFRSVCLGGPAPWGKLATSALRAIMEKIVPMSAPVGPPAPARGRAPAPQAESVSARRASPGRPVTPARQGILARPARLAPVEGPIPVTGMEFVTTG